MIFSNATITPNPSILLHTSAHTKILDHSGIQFYTPGFSKTISYQLTLTLRKTVDNIVIHTELAKNKEQIIMKFPVVNDRIVSTFVDHEIPIDFLTNASTH